jgi:hypothetical protein
MPIEHAFDRSHITFVYDKNLSQFVLKLLKPGLSKLTFRQYISEERNADTNQLFIEKYKKKWEEKKKHVFNLKNLLDQTFMDFEEKPFAFPFSSTVRCYYRCLAFQQSMAMLFAEEKGWISKEDVQSPSMWSDLEEGKIASVSSWVERVKTSAMPIEVQD